MCLIGLALRVHPDCPVILISNRDEYHSRPTAPLSQWASMPEAYGGQDLKAGGGWLMANRSGRWAALTNIRDLRLVRPFGPSRGELVQKCVDPKIPLEALKAEILSQKDRYSGFNLLVGDMDQVDYLSSYQSEWQSVPTGIHSLSNDELNSPWPKARQTQKNLAQLLHHSADALTHENLVAQLSSPDPHPKRLRPNTGIPAMMEKMLSASLILSAKYGTVSQSSLVLREDGLHFGESSLNTRGQEKERQQFEIPFASLN